jgi:hypothetical protein
MLNIKLTLSLILTFFSLTSFAVQDPNFQNLEDVKVNSGECARILAKKSKATSLKNEKEIVITTWNLANLFDEPDMPQQWHFAAKQNKIKSIGSIVGSEGSQLSHFVISTEVENLNIAEQFFSTGLLEGAYDSFLIEGNDSRGLDIMLAVRSDLDVIVESETHRDTTWMDPVLGQQTRLFPRDLPAWIIRDRKTNEVLLVILGNHGKSKRDRNGRQGQRDPESNVLREAQYQAVGIIVENYKKRFGPDIPLVFAGDFNTEIQSSPSLEPVRALLHDTLELVGAENRVTHNFFPDHGMPKRQQLDAIFVNEKLATKIKKALVIPEFDRKTGAVLPEPRNFKERTRNPSDHHAVTVVIDNK